MPSGFNSTIEIKEVTTSDNTHTILSRNIPRWMPLHFLPPIVMLTPKWEIFGLCHYCIRFANYGGCHTGQCVRCDGDTITLRYDYTILFEWNLTHWRQRDNDTITTGRCDTVTTQHAFPSLPQSSTKSPHETQKVAESGNWQSCVSARSCGFEWGY